LNAALAYDDAIAAMAHLIAPARDVLYLGRGRTSRWRWKAR
jgi:glucosamine--fructose-6-phosphate aminotransferase (isomerizing)